MHSRRLLVAIFLVSWVNASYPSPASAQDDIEAARAHFSRGTRLYEVGEYRQALAEFKAAHISKPDSAFLYNIAQCHRQLGELDQAVVMYKRYLSTTPKATNRSEVEKRIADIEAELAAPRVTKATLLPSSRSTVTAPGPGAAGASVQTIPAATPLPGPDVPQISAPSPDTHATSSLRTLRWVGVGATAALVGAAIGTGLSASSKYDELKNSCGSTPAGCGNSQIDSVKSRALVTNVLWGLAAVAAVGTGVMFYLTPTSAAAQVAWGF